MEGQEAQEASFKLLSALGEAAPTETQRARNARFVTAMSKGQARVGLLENDSISEELPCPKCFPPSGVHISMTRIGSAGADRAGGRHRAGEDGPAGAAPELGLQVPPEPEPAEGTSGARVAPLLYASVMWKLSLRDLQG